MAAVSLQAQGPGLRERLRLNQHSWSFQLLLLTSRSCRSAWYSNENKRLLSRFNGDTVVKIKSLFSSCLVILAIPLQNKKVKKIGRIEGESPDASEDTSLRINALICSWRLRLHVREAEGRTCLSVFTGRPPPWLLGEGWPWGEGSPQTATQGDDRCALPCWVSAHKCWTLLGRRWRFRWLLEGESRTPSRAEGDPA